MFLTTWLRQTELIYHKFSKAVTINHCQNSLIAKILIAECPIGQILIAERAIAKILIAERVIAKILIAEILITKILIAEMTNCQNTDCQNTGEPYLGPSDPLSKEFLSSACNTKILDHFKLLEF